ncbi:hypothetical protein AFL01nite_16430 [Aeromicrobium flavum]|uniref:Uncharacterized protein n=1 Tax=Aeromicrobium flavum TaxID=416568 RepID=A0A512HV38_9ACTN|nr:hypothetical protein [Aeromicrobium flavum]GEO89316.1 hypothetical protein AFL01nite_16430 [Aeromicrobium flavum]
MTVRRLLYLVVAVVAALFVVWLVLFLTRGDTSSATGSDPYPDHAEGVAFVDEAVVYDDLGRMAATANVVVRGTVTEVAPGATHQYTPEQSVADETDRVLTVRVDEVVANGARGAPAVGTSIRIVEGWWSEGIGYETEGMPWSEVGQEGYFFLAKDSGPSGGYTYVGTTGRALLTDEGAEVSGDHHGDGPWDGTVGGKLVDSRAQAGADAHRAPSVADLRSRVLAAADLARRGVAKPMTLPNPAQPND